MPPDGEIGYSGISFPESRSTVSRLRFSLRQSRISQGHVRPWRVPPRQGRCAAITSRRRK